MAWWSIRSVEKNQTSPLARNFGIHITPRPSQQLNTAFIEDGVLNTGVVSDDGSEDDDDEEEEDVHEDMRHDVDNMSYEELLDLEEYIGSVGTGLNDEVVSAHLRRRKYESITLGLPKQDEPCCICREYVDGEELGKLDCRHDFHFDCIRLAGTEKLLPRLQIEGLRCS